jgi:hypothetical protein
VDRRAPATEWATLSEVPVQIRERVVLDFDRASRCCGFEIVDRRLLVPRDSASPEPLPALATVPEFEELLSEWRESVVTIAGEGDPRLSFHGHSRKGYDFSAELEGLLEDGIGWLMVGLGSNGRRFAGLRFLDPTEHVRGIQQSLRKSYSGKTRCRGPR